jgi:hypothetical protein
LSLGLERVIVTTGAGCVGEIRRVTEFETPPGPILRIEERELGAGGLN